MKRFADLCIRPLLDNKDEIDQMAKLSKVLGISLVGIVFERNHSQNLIDKIIMKFNKNGIDAVKRLDLIPRNRIELLKDLRKYRGKYEIISVKCINTEVSIVASRDRRVDLITIGKEMSLRNRRRAISRISNKTLEIEISEILDTSKPRIVVLKRLNEEIFFAKTNKIPIVISSGARDSFMMRSPRDMAALGIFLGLEESEAIESVSKIPFNIVETNREKLSSKWISDGVKMVRVQKK